MAIRDQHFFFAKKLIPAEVFRSPGEMFAELTGPKREAFLMYLWMEAGKSVGGSLPHVDVVEYPGAGVPQLVKLEVVGAIKSEGWEVVVVSMPPALAPNEAVFIALARKGDETRLFFWERCLDAAMTGEAGGDGVLSEVRGDQSRSNYGFFPGLGLDDFCKNLGGVLGVKIEGVRGSLPEIDMAAFLGAGGGPKGAPQASRLGGPPSPGRSVTPSDVRSFGELLAKIIAVRAGLPLVMFLVGFVLMNLIGQFYGIVSTLLTLMSLVIGVMLMIWTFKIFDVQRGKTSFSPGMAVGAWLIPLGNIFLPPFVLRDAWKCARGPQGSLIIFVWWLFWLLEIVFVTLRSLGVSIQTELESGASYVHVLDQIIELPDGIGGVLGAAYSYGGLLVTVAAYGLLWHIVKKISEKL